MFLFEKFIKNTEQSLVPSDISSNTRENITLDEITENLPVQHPNTTKKIKYEIFITACSKNSKLEKIITDVSISVIDAHIATYLTGKDELTHYFKNNEHKNSNIIKTFLEIRPFAIFKIISSNKFNFNIMFPKIKDKIDPKIVDEYNKNFAYYIGNINDIIQLLESDFEFDVNHIAFNNLTFVTYFAINNTTTNKDMIKLVDCLTKRKYNFNNVSMNDRSIFCLALNANSYVNKCELAKILVSIPELDVLVETTWLKLLIKRNDNSYSNNESFNLLLASILIRDDYESFLCRLIHKYLYETAEKDLTIICLYFYSINLNKFLKMLLYVGKNGNTFVHRVAQMHFKQLLILIHPIIENSIKPNNDGKLPSDLYSKSKMINVFAHIQQ